ncbi:MAG TPA: DUF2993 domain-containing protein [Actinomycetota bacterium]|jgi:hypothetical protein
MRRLLVFLVILGLILVVADFALKAVGEYFVARELRVKLGLAHNPSVSLISFPFIPHLVSGDFDTVQITSKDNSIRGINVESFRLNLHDVRFAPRQLVTGKDATIRGREGDGRLEITGEAVTEALNRAGVPLRVRFEGGEVIIGSPQLHIEGRAELSTSNGRLVLTPAGFPRFFSLSLPQFIRGLEYTGAKVHGSNAELTYRVAEPTFEVSA